MTPPDSCSGMVWSLIHCVTVADLLTDCFNPHSDSFSPTSGPLFPHMAQHQHPFDRVTDFRRVPSL
jgi:hypothetical protein